jgi:guanosine-3',5'-bis(diphosphate) 3'-pyrophosphohydrolase
VDQAIREKYPVPDDWEDPEGLDELLSTVRKVLFGANAHRIRYAYMMAEDLHRGQFRGTGDPYIIHPLAVARILADLRMDEDTIVAALLHDVLEDCDRASRDQIRSTFGQDVLHLVEGVTKLELKALNVPDGATTVESSRAAETLRKMLLAMAKDVRVMVIKLADRLHNLQTLDGLPPEKRTRIASETLDIYAPLAGRLGIWKMRWQLEDLCFKHLHPTEFQEVSDMVAKSQEQREQELHEAISILRNELRKKDIVPIDITGRPKHLYSIFNKMVKSKVDFDQILDLLAIRVIVEEPSECYLVLGIIHDLWVPIPGLFFDYIAKPKTNGYQSLHTKVIGPRGEPFEVQIRTKQMHHIAEYGVASHWLYKEGIKNFGKDAIRQSRLRQQLFDWSNENRTSSAFLKSVSTDLFSEQVFVFTPKGDVIDLPVGSTPIDFAFRVHSEIGLTVVGAKINGVLVSLDAELENGDIVELITRSNARPSLDWLDYAKSPNTRSKLRAYFRKLNQDENAEQGRLAVEKSLLIFGLNQSDLDNESGLLALAREVFGFSSVKELLAKVGEGQISAENVVLKLYGKKQAEEDREIIRTEKTKEGKVRLAIEGLNNLILRRAKCCDPLPGEDVVGYVSRGRGMMIHRRICGNLELLAEDEPDRLYDLEWPKSDVVYSTMLRIITLNRQGLLMEISTIFGKSKINIPTARLRTLPNQTAEIDMTVEIKDLSELESVIKQVRSVPDVVSVTRIFETQNKK